MIDEQIVAFLSSIIIQEHVYAKSVSPVRASRAMNHHQLNFPRFDLPCNFIQLTLGRWGIEIGLRLTAHVISLAVLGIFQSGCLVGKSCFRIEVHKS